MRRWVTLGIVALAAAMWCAPATGRADVSDPAQAAREIADARERANQSAQAYFDQQAKLDELDTAQQELTDRIDAAQQDVDELQDKASEVAVTRYVNAGTGNLPLLDAFQSVDDQVQMRALISVVAAGSADDYDRYQAARAELDAQQALLDAKRDEAERERRRLDQLRQDAIAQVEHLKQVQADRLEDEAVRTALAAEEAQRNRAAIQAAAAAATPATSTSILVGGANADNGNPDGDVESAVTTSTAPGASTTTTSPVSGAGPIGGRATPITLPTPTPIGGVGGDYGGPGWVCPTGQAAVSFSDTWGAPRSGGRRHEGVDMIGTEGTPVLAVVDGVAVAKENVLGGMTVSLTGADGNRYYYAHLDGYANLGNVKAGTQIGILGQTGNARFSVPHLHFEIHPGGGQAVDPFPTARAHCLGTA